MVSAGAYGARWPWFNPNLFQTLFSFPKIMEKPTTSHFKITQFLYFLCFWFGSIESSKSWFCRRLVCFQLDKFRFLDSPPQFPHTGGFLDFSASVKLGGEKSPQREQMSSRPSILGEGGSCQPQSGCRARTNFLPLTHTPHIAKPPPLIWGLS